MAQRGSMFFVIRVCLVAALGGLLFGYDTAVISGAIGFLQKHFHLDAAMKGWAASSALLGCVIGVSMAGIINDCAGRKMAQLLAGILFFVSALGTAVAGGFNTFILFRIMGGVGVGIASMTVPMYIAEISPAKIRGRMVSINQFAIVSGILLIYFVNYFISLGGNEAWNVDLGWRWMFASGVVPAAIFLLLLLTVPESPRWLIEHHQLEKAKAVLLRVGGPEFSETESAAIHETVLLESQKHVRLFSREMRFVLFLGIALATLQQVTGINIFFYYATEIFRQLGSGPDMALLETIVVGAVNLGFTFVAIWNVDRLGRKPLMIFGASGMTLSLAAMSVASWHHLAGWMIFCILCYIACFASSVGPVTWVILSEIFPNCIRAKAMSLATFALWTANFIVSQTFPMMDENPWLIARFHHAFPFFVYAAFCITLIFVVWLGVPETKGRSLEEIEKHWAGGKE